jgi:acetolactate synthase-1/3 small subunit
VKSKEGNVNGLPGTIVELRVKNHPGVMSHVTGLFSRRGFNLEGILCAPVQGGGESRMYLLVNNDERLEQIVKQLQKLHDVNAVAVRDDFDHEVFNRIEELIGGGANRDAG